METENKAQTTDEIIERLRSRFKSRGMLASGSLFDKDETAKIVLDESSDEVVAKEKPLKPEDFEGIDLKALVEGAQKFAKPDASKTPPDLLEAFRRADEMLENRERIDRENES